MFSTCKSNNESYNGDIYCNPVSIVSYINTSTTVSNFFKLHIQVPIQIIYTVNTLTSNLFSLLKINLTKNNSMPFRDLSFTSYLKYSINISKGSWQQGSFNIKSPHKHQACVAVYHLRHKPRAFKDIQQHRKINMESTDSIF